MDERKDYYTEYNIERDRLRIIFPLCNRPRRVQLEDTVLCVYERIRVIRKENIRQMLHSAPTWDTMR